MFEVNKSGWNTDAIGDIDHRIVKAPYIRLDSFKEGKNGDCVFKYDLRFTQPNKEFIKSDALHSLEHFLLYGFRKNVSSFLGVAPMGCHTGLYLFLLNDYEPDCLVSYLSRVLQDVLLANEVPLATEETCGHAANHCLDGAKKIANDMLSQKELWLTVV